MPTDYLEDADGDLAFGPDGDFVRTESTNQHKRSLLLAQKGEFRQWPLIGVGISDFINDDRLDEMGPAIQKEFENDGMQVNKMDVYQDGKVVEDGRYPQ